MTNITVHSPLDDSQVGLSPRPHGLSAGAHLSRAIRRRQVRFGVRTLRVDSPVFGEAIEVSASGMRLESVAPLVVGGSYIFRFRYGARFLSLPGRVAWCRPHRIEITRQGRRTIYQTGIELRPGKPDRRWRTALANRAGVEVGV